MGMRALVTGGTGFLGSYMATYLSAHDWEVTATHPPHSANSAVPLPARVTLRPLDVTQAKEVARLVGETTPDVIFHFAGQAFVIPSWENPAETFAVNLTGTLHLLEAVRRLPTKTRFAFAGSGTEYGAPSEIPTTEAAPLRPTSPYAASKAAADLLCYQYHQSFGLPVFRYRIFGTTGWGKRGDSTNDFASQVARLENDGPPRAIHVGNLDKQRDITDVRDAVRAMATVAERGEPGEAYNIGSGEPRHVRRTLDYLLSLARQPIDVVVDDTRLRRVDEPIHLADVRRLRELGWSPEIPFSQTLAEILDGWRRTLRPTDAVEIRPSA